ncbi:MAG: TonB-dependent receptor [Novosphingobium sp.]|jgi:iron complex outermembrane receptor protein|nr:TonB-dependent receptor [Novosphingobium sp.]
MNRYDRRGGQWLRAALGTASLLAMCGAPAAFAQAAPDAGRPAIDTGEIIVTARKQQESILKVPVVVTAVQGEKLDTLGATEIMDLPKLVPGLALSRGVLSNGLFVSLRGVGTSSLDSGIDQSISLNIDGLTFTQGLAFASGMFDLAQIEVMKGPQALFYGKASPGGVISMRTADPTDRLEVMLRGGYEFEARERRVEAVLSGPLSDTLLARLAGNYAAADGYFINVSDPQPGTGALPPADRRQSRARNYHLRGTLLWKPVDNFSARLKANIVRDDYVNPEGAQLGSCPQGPGLVLPPRNIAFIGGDDCKLNRSVSSPYADPAAFPGITNNGVPYNRTTQKYGSLELNYDLTPQLSLNSTTGYYRMRSSNLYLPSAYGAGPPQAPSNRFGRKDFTQELRLSSSFDGSVNFIAGGFYQDAWVYDRIITIGNQALGFGSIRADGETMMRIKAYSLFGQVRWNITSDLELAGGARWTDEKRSQAVRNNLTGAAVDTITDGISARNVAPEVTLTYTPTQNLTVFGAYKVAYKSGSFAIGTVPLATVDNSFGDEKVEGGEIGVKARLLDRQLQANIAGYYYKYSGLQVGAIVAPSDPTALPINRIINAGAARTYGIDFDAVFRPRDIEGLEINLSASWNNGKFTQLEGVPCWVGQTVALGCDQIFARNANQTPPGPAGAVLVNGQYGFYTAQQDLSGLPLIRAPQFQANFGFNYEMPVASGYKLVFSNSNQFSTRMMRFLAINRPDNDNFQESFIKVDASVALRGPNDRWEIALIGKNINDKITAGICSAGNYAGGLAVVPAITGGTTSGAAGLGQTNCFPERGRSVWMRLTLRPFN